MVEDKTDDDWAEDWGPCVKKDENEGIWHYETLEEALVAADKDVYRLWTIVQGDGMDGRDCEWICAGNHIVNRVSYLVSTKKWENPQTIPPYLWWEYDNEFND